MKVKFTIHYNTNWGQKLYVCGSPEFLGAGNTAKARMMYPLPGGFWETEVDISDEKTDFSYFYCLNDENFGFTQKEFGADRKISLKDTGTDYVIKDFWRSPSEENNVLQTSAFYKALLRPETEKKTTKPGRKGRKKKGHPVRFRLRAPRIAPGMKIGILGSDPALGAWDPAKIVLAEAKDFPVFEADVFLEKTDAVSYKYAVYNTENQSVNTWEDGENRLFIPNDSDEKKIFDVITDEHFRFTGPWRGAGVAVPVFSLRSDTNTGVGEFSDLLPLTDWAERTGLKMLQILPVNDTVATHSWTDSYPYAAISVFALHPIYANLQKMGTLSAELNREIIDARRKVLNTGDKVDYEAVMQLKSRFFKLIFDQQKSKFAKDPAAAEFIKTNADWLKPYAAFSYLRDLFGTCKYDTWGRFSVFSPAVIEEVCDPEAAHYEDIAIHYFIQFHLDQQLKEASEYARKKGIVLKGDIPIGIYRHSADAWSAPHLYHLDAQAGAPPDDFAVAGQNWKFPTYNWEKMAEDGYAWWQARLAHMGRYFDAYRIDHILGFFRIWQIPGHVVEGLLGQFNPAMPLHRNDLADKGLWLDYERYCKPYIRTGMLWEMFDRDTDFVIRTFLDEHRPGVYFFKPEFDTQKKIEAYFAEDVDTPAEVRSHNKKLRTGLYQLIGEVLFFEDENQAGHFHPRNSLQKTRSFQDLDGHLKETINEIYTDFFYRRHEEFWREKALSKLPAVASATDMLVCGEDLGMVPDCVPPTMREAGMLSLEIQRMPKNPKLKFGHPADYPYLSVASTSTHDMANLRAWWEEDRESTQRFYNEILGQTGPAPQFCEPEIARQIIVQHLYSPAMWTVFPLQDLLAMDSKLRPENPEDEQINVPANPNHYWRFRFSISVEKLLAASDFNSKLEKMLREAGRKLVY